MQIAISEAQKAYEEGEVPVGCVIVAENKLIARTHNQVERLKDATAHAEMIAISAAMQFFQSKYLEDCTLYVTLEPCPMCAYAMNLTHIRRVVWAADDEKQGFRKWGNLLHPKTQIRSGILSDPARNLLQKFFKKLR